MDFPTGRKDHNMENMNVVLPEAPKHKKRHFVVWVLLIALGLMFAGSLIGEILVALLLRLVPMSDGMVFAASNYLTFIGIDALVLLYCALAEKDVFRSFGAARRGGGKGNTGKGLALGLLVGFGTNALCVLVAWLAGNVDFSVGRFEVLYLLAAFIMVAIQSGAEELLTRGYIFGALSRRYNVWVALACNALLFGALHLLNTGVTVLSIVNIVVYGVLLSLVMIYHGSLWFCIAMHTAWNFTQNYLFGLPNSGLVAQQSFLHLEAVRGDVLYSALFGVEGGVVCTVVIGLCCVAAVLLGRKK